MSVFNPAKYIQIIQGRPHPLPGDPEYGCLRADGAPKRVYPSRKDAKKSSRKGQRVYPCTQHGGVVWHIGGLRRPPKP